MVCALVLLGALPNLALADTLAALNALRRHGCAGARGGLTPLAVDAKLGRAAERVARGEALGSAVTASGYRALQSTVLVVQGAAGDAELGRVLEQQFCKQINERALRHAGVYSRAGARGRSDTWVVLAAPVTLPAIDVAQMRSQLLALVNRARAEQRRCGGRSMPPAAPVRWSSVLERVAAAHARDMAEHRTLSHTGSDGSDASERVSRARYAWRAVGENVAAGQRSAQEVVANWLTSAGHCANLMSTEFTEMGAAFATNAASDLGIYWAQVLAAPDTDRSRAGSTRR